MLGAIRQRDKEARPVVGAVNQRRGLSGSGWKDRRAVCVSEKTAEFSGIAPAVRPTLCRPCRSTRGSLCTRNCGFPRLGVRGGRSFDHVRRPPKLLHYLLAELESNDFDASELRRGQNRPTNLTARPSRCTISPPRTDRPCGVMSTLRAIAQIEARADRALAPCGRGRLGGSTTRMGEGSDAPRPHPTEFAELMRCPLPQAGEGMPFTPRRPPIAARRAATSLRPSPARARRRRLPRLVRARRIPSPGARPPEFRRSRACCAPAASRA